MKWIKFEDRMPETGVDVLLCLDNNDITIGYRNYYNRYYTYDVYDIRDLDQLRAWMPLPEPPKEE